MFLTHLLSWDPIGSSEQLSGVSDAIVRSQEVLQFEMTANMLKHSLGSWTPGEGEGSLRGLRLPVVILGQVGDERHGHAHIDTCPDGNWQDGEEESPPGAGAGQVKVSFGHGLVGLRGTETEKQVRQRLAPHFVRVTRAGKRNKTQETARTLQPTKVSWNGSDSGKLG